MKKSLYNTILLQVFISYLLPTAVLAQQHTTAIQSPIELNYEAPGSYLIEDIQVEGAHSLDKKAILSLAGLKVNNIVELPGAAISKAIHRLWKQDLIKEVDIYASQVKDHRVVLTISITESARLSSYSFEGINKKEQEELLTQLNLVKGKVVNDELIKRTKRAIKKYWTEKGYLNIAVAIASIPDSPKDEHVGLHIKISKGKQFKVNTIDFEGNQHISSDILKIQPKYTRGKPRFTLVKDVLKQVLTLQPIKKGGILWRSLSLEEIHNYCQKHVIISSAKFDPIKFKEDKKRIIDYYQSKGFRDAVIVKETISKQEDGLLSIKIEIDEGERYQIGSIQWVGNYRYDDDTLNEVIGIKKGDIYNRLLLQQKLDANPHEQNVAALYRNHGHLFFRAELVEVGLAGNKVALEIRVHEGPEASINKILIEGNEHTRENVIRRELRTLPGDKFSMANLVRSYRELAMLNIFDPAIGIEPMPNTDGTVDIKYSVKERLNLKIELSGKLAREDGFVGGLTLATNNFSLGNLLAGRLPIGDRQTLSIKAERNGKQYRNLGFQFVEPWLGGTKPRQLYLGLNKSSKEGTGSTGGRLGLGTRLSWPDDYTVFRSSIAYYRHYYKDYDLLGNDKKVTGVLNDLSTTISLERDSTDSPIYPKQGSKLELTAKLTPPLSWLSNNTAKTEAYRWKEYHQWIVDGSYFLHLVHDLVLHARGQFGVLGGFSSQKSVGPFERFYLGGVNSSHSLRGKESVSLRGYQDEYFPLTSKRHGYKGGVIYDKFALELRYPIVSSHFASIYTLAFLEAGNTWTDYKNYNLFDLKKSAGLGLRLYLPFIVGTTIGFDWGYGFDKKLEDKSNDKLEFHFSLGAGSGR